MTHFDHPSVQNFLNFSSFSYLKGLVANFEYIDYLSVLKKGIYVFMFVCKDLYRYDTLPLIR